MAIFPQLSNPGGHIVITSLLGFPSQIWLKVLQLLIKCPPQVKIWLKILVYHAVFTLVYARKKTFWEKNQVQVDIQVNSLLS